MPTDTITKIIRAIKNITAREVFRAQIKVKSSYGELEFWSGRYCASAVEKHGDEGIIIKYVKNQGKSKKYQKIYEDRQLKLF